MELRSMELRDWELTKLGEDIWHKKYQNYNECVIEYLKDLLKNKGE